MTIFSLIQTHDITSIPECSRRTLKLRVIKSEIYWSIRISVSFDVVQYLIEVSPKSLYKLSKLSLTHSANFANLFRKNEAIGGFSQTFIVAFENQLKVRSTALDDFLVLLLGFGNGLSLGVGLQFLSRPLSLWEQIASLIIRVLLIGAM